MNRVDIGGVEFRWNHVESISSIDEQQWDTCAGDNPLVRHAFFRALETSGSTGFDHGVVPGYFLLRDRTGTLVACVPTALKWGNLREFGPEITWIQAGLARDCFQWPKFQACSPLFPRMAPKLLVHPQWRSAAFRAGLLRLLIGLGAAEGRFSAFNLMHLPAEDARECAAEGALISYEQRSAWTNPGVVTFDDYVVQLPHRKRRMLRRERARTEALGLTVAVRHGAEVSPALATDFYAGYRAVCRRHGHETWLPPAVFEQLCARMPDAVRIFTVHDGDRYVAGLFCFQNRDTLFVDTWSAPDDVPDLCFEMLCYRPMEYAIEHNLTSIDAGLSSPYKTVRGYRADPVFNAHWFYDERLAALARTVLNLPAYSAGERLLDVG